MIKLLTVTILICVFCGHVMGQPVYLRDFSGKPFLIKHNSELTGSPFLFTNWRVAKIKLKREGEFDNVKVKFDVYENIFYYNQNDSLYIFSDDVKEVRIKDDQHPNETGYDLIFKKDLSAGGEIPHGKFIQVLCEGKISLIKYYRAGIEEFHPTSSYDNQSNEKKMLITSRVYAITGSGIQNVQYNLKKLEALTHDKNIDINTFIKSKGLNVKKEMDFTAVIAYYNLISY